MKFFQSPVIRYLALLREKGLWIVSGEQTKVVNEVGLIVVTASVRYFRQRKGRLFKSFDDCIEPGDSLELLRTVPSVMDEFSFKMPSGQVAFICQLGNR